MKFKLLLLLLGAFLFLFSNEVNAQQEVSGSLQAEERHEAVVTRIDKDMQMEIAPGVTQPMQEAEVEIKSGETKGQKVLADMGGLIVSNEKQKVNVGDNVFISHIRRIDGQDQYLISDFKRTGSLLILGIAFLIAVIIVGRFRGLSSFLGLIISMVTLIKFIIPQIVSGASPVMTAIIGSLFILTTTLYLAHGINRKTTAALVGTFLSLVITSALAFVFVNFAKLSGFGSEEAGFLSMFPGMQVNLQGILLAGIIIGALGVLDDITVSQSACVFELHDANKSLSFGELYKRGLRIGRDHIASLVNTLVLAYAGASLPLLLLFALSGGEPVSQLFNREMIANEVVRTLVGSLGLVSAVPITTAIAAGLSKVEKFNYGFTI